MKRKKLDKFAKEKEEAKFFSASDILKGVENDEKWMVLFPEDDEYPEEEWVRISGGYLKNESELFLYPDIENVGDNVMVIVTDTCVDPKNPLKAFRIR